ncbi:hypothetical protein HDU97_000535 [Phlyctochytrium planicorne]|nr:hypothetical protein HDU97_000535 [Phlyctochytrium planicorne]
MTDIDEELRQRYERLKAGAAASGVAAPTEEDLILRFKKLTGHEPVAYATPSPSTSSPQRNPSDEADQLLASALASIKTSSPTLPVHDPTELNVPVPANPIPLVDVSGTPSQFPSFVDYTELVLTSPSKVFQLSEQKKKTPAEDDESEIENLIEAVAREVKIEERYGKGTAAAAEKGLEERLKHLRAFVPTDRASSSSFSSAGGAPPQLQPSRPSSHDASLPKQPSTTTATPLSLFTTKPSTSTSLPASANTPTPPTPSTNLRKKAISPLGAPPPIVSLSELLPPSSTPTSPTTSKSISGRFLNILGWSKQAPPGGEGSSATETERDEDTDEEEDDGFCCICDKEAVVKCPGCEGDVYCVSCWKEGHVENVDVEFRKHVAERIVKKKK